MPAAWYLLSYPKDLWFSILNVRCLVKKQSQPVYVLSLTRTLHKRALNSRYPRHEANALPMSSTNTKNFPKPIVMFVYYFITLSSTRKTINIIQCFELINLQIHMIHIFWNSNIISNFRFGEFVCELCWFSKQTSNHNVIVSRDNIT